MKPILLFLTFALFTLSATAQEAPKVEYTGYSYSNGELHLIYSFPAEAVTMLQRAGKLETTKAAADKLGEDGARGLNNHVHEATQTVRKNRADYFEVFGTPTQKNAADIWADTLGTFDRENPIEEIGLLFDLEGFEQSVDRSLLAGRMEFERWMRK